MARAFDPLGALMAARGRLMPWAPVCMAAGIGAYFTLPREPAASEWVGLAVVCLALVALSRFGPERVRIPATALALVAGGMVAAGLRAQSVSEPVLTFRYYGAVEGRVVDIDRSYSDQIRVTLDRVVLERVAPRVTPARVRVALHGEQGFVALEPGLRVILTAHLAPPEGPVEPGGFDFQRLAWFEGLGAVGYTRAPVLAIGPAERSFGLAAFRWRMTLSRAIQARIPGQPGAFAAALVTGDRSGVVSETTVALRNSNLSHLISISGLHMGLLAGFVFAALRYGMALVPAAALRLPVKKIAAAVAIAAATAYLTLAGPNVATQRAYIMALVMLVAVLADRRALSLRSVAMAALVLLAFRPETLTEPGFQMSFGATTALIGGFAILRAPLARVPALLKPVAMLLTSSMIAGMATAPIAAAHFNRIAEYGLLANLLAVPLMGLAVMPAAVAAAVLAPVGAAGPALWVMGQGTAAILGVARWVAGLEGAVLMVPSPPAPVLPLLAFGGILGLIARARAGRLAGIALLSAGFLGWHGTGRPDALVAPGGALVGVMGPEGRALSKPRGAGFVADNWLQGDGDPADQETAFARAGASGKAQARFALGQTTLWHFTGKRGAELAAQACRPGAIVILAGDGAVSGGCDFFSQARLRQTGALAISLKDGVPGIVTARQVTGERLWNRLPPRRGETRLAASQ